ncbi:acetyl-CoA carboxylase biotin carboxyl carrier protein subunit [Brenneria sp. 4F2]|nr:acetyl-CoA carboxylase biotin carboxyl carrier protein subunit [Brenneria bubanii]
MHISQLAFKDLRDVAHKMRQSGLSQIEIGGNGYRVRLKFDPVVVASGDRQTATPSSAAQTSMLSAPMPGAVWLWHPSNGEPFAPIGSAVRQGEVLALLKVGLIYLPLRSPVDGVVDALQVSQGELVEYQSAILRLRKTEVSS